MKVPNYSVEHESASEKRRGSDSGGWALENDNFGAWLDVSSRPDSEVLYINGIPGAGNAVNPIPRISVQY